MKQSKKQKEALNKELPYLSNTELISKKNKMMLALSLGYFFYIISFSTLPFAFNYYFSKGKLKHYKTTAFGAHDEDLYDADKLANNGLQQSTFTKVIFKHEDVIFTINIGKTKSSTYLYYTMDEGFFGWDIVKEAHFL
ncbi:hypothetical protein FRY74_08605 [Vicingus serpentipes]|uniref:Uncharacterized protein n=1 Tax=Vicingus serpentipes TaxID=1926625 RepID=A0A5C6RVU0_9FLAO|nr:hypothetical protein [Vicingus serpentipes]TXB65472.1 hypothetical protein FRY74_08605 [Vicingus serpentipes]